MRGDEVVLTDDERRVVLDALYIMMSMAPKTAHVWGAIAKKLEGVDKQVVVRNAGEMTPPANQERDDWVLVPPTATVDECGGNWCVWLDPAAPYVWGFASRDDANRLARAINLALRCHKRIGARPGMDREENEK